MTNKDNKESDESEKTSEKLALLAEAVDDLYSYRDNYIEQHSETEAFKKVPDVEKKLEEVLEKFEQNKDVEPNERAQYFYLQGKALNVTPFYSSKAEEALSRAIKLDVKMFEAWNELGESYWKKEDVTEAKNCFLGALKHCRNKKSLRNLSMVMRMEKPAKYEDRIENIRQGIKYAKEALDLDPTDGTSWSVLGNAYLSSFFNISQNPSVLNLSKSAYSRAEHDIVANSNPDLHFNKAIVAKYEEDYVAALNSFSKAYRLEPSWEEPKQKQSQLINYLTKVNELYRGRGKVKGRKLHKMLQNLIPSKHLGPYNGGKYKATNGHEIKLTHICFDDLEEGLNEEKVILGVVVCSVQDEDNVPFTFVMVDNNESTLVVTVYNLAQEKGVLIGDYVAIPEPYLTTINVAFEGKHYSFRSVRVVSPLVMVVNGKKVDKSKQSGLQLSTFALHD